MILCPRKLLGCFFVCLNMWQLQATLTTAPGTCPTTSTRRSTLTTTPTSPSSPPSLRSSPWAPATTTTPPPPLTSEDFRVASNGEGRKNFVTPRSDLYFSSLRSCGGRLGKRDLIWGGSNYVSKHNLRVVSKLKFDIIHYSCHIDTSD